MAITTQRLYDLLPALYRERDGAEGEPLRALLELVAREAHLLENDIEGLWNDLFVETCADWVIPYIGDLVGNDLLFDATRVEPRDAATALFTDVAGPDLRPAVAARVRADVANTIFYRRRKGTLAMLERLARDVTGWAAHAVEFFQLLGWTQNVEHLRVQSAWTDVRSVERLDRVDGPFDAASHTVDVRRIGQLEGWHGIHNVGFFLWRLGSYPLAGVPAREASAPRRFHFSPLGNPTPLFARAAGEDEADGMSTELDVPGPIRRSFFHDDLARHAALSLPRPDFTDLYGAFAPIPGSTLEPAPRCSLFVVRDGIPVHPDEVVCRRLDPWPAAPPAGAVVAVDVATGRLAIGAGFPAPAAVDVFFHYGFAADLGGGPYDRRKWLVRRDGGVQELRVQEGAAAPVHADVAAALAAWEAAGKPDAVVSILDSRTYDLPPAITLRNDRRLVIEAANRQRPVLRTVPAGLEIDVEIPGPATPERRGELTLSGVVVEGSLHVVGDLARLRLLHSTLVPGRRLDENGEPETSEASLVVEDAAGGDAINTELRVEAAYTICGPLVVPEHAVELVLLDCIVDGANGGGTAVEGPKLTIERTTVLGTTRTRELEASESIFTGAVVVDRTQAGCFRFSYAPPGSRTPRRYRAQPDLAVSRALEDALRLDPTTPAAEQQRIRAEVEAAIVPTFTARRYGRPGYAQLHLTCPNEIAQGAADGSEMGAFCHRKQPQRESNLRIRLAEYLPFGLDAAPIYVT